jgi:hypothetical protein
MENESKKCLDLRNPSCAANNPINPKARRLLKPEGIIAVIGYPLMNIDDETDKAVLHLYSDTLASAYWDKERKYLEEHYQTIPFPFNEISTPEFSNQYEWNFEQLIGYLNTWSAVQHYINKNKNNPVEMVKDELKKACGPTIKKTVSFPVLLRVGKMS